MEIALNEGDRSMLGRWVKSRAVGDKHTLPARMVLMTADGCPAKAIMATLNVSNQTLNVWRNRYLERRHKARLSVCVLL